MENKEKTDKKIINEISIETSTTSNSTITSTMNVSPVKTNNSPNTTSKKVKKEISIGRELAGLLPPPVNKLEKQILTNNSNSNNLTDPNLNKSGDRKQQKRPRQQQKQSPKSINKQVSPQQQQTVETKKENI